MWWMPFAAILLALLAIAGLYIWRIVRLRRRARSFLALSKHERLVFARLLIRDGGLPFVPRTVAALAAGYLALPIDLIPDFIPIVGHADDFVVVTLLAALIAKRLPQEKLDELAQRARDTERLSADRAANVEPLVPAGPLSQRFQRLTDRRRRVPLMPGSSAKRHGGGAP